MTRQKCLTMTPFVFPASQFKTMEEWMSTTSSPFSDCGAEMLNITDQMWSLVRRCPDRDQIESSSILCEEQRKPRVKEKKRERRRKSESFGKMSDVDHSSIETIRRATRTLLATERLIVFGTSSSMISTIVERWEARPTRERRADRRRCRHFCAQSVISFRGSLADRSLRRRSNCFCFRSTDADQIEHPRCANSFIEKRSLEGADLRSLPQPIRSKTDEKRNKLWRDWSIEVERE